MMDLLKFNEEDSGLEVVQIVKSGDRDTTKLTVIMDFDNFELNLKECYELQKFLKRNLP